MTVMSITKINYRHTNLTLGLPQFAFESSEDSLDLPESLLFRKVLNAGLQIPVQAVQQEFLQDQHKFLCHFITCNKDFKKRGYETQVRSFRSLLAWRRISSLMLSCVSGRAGMVAMLDQRRGRTTGFSTTSPKSSLTCVKNTYRTRFPIWRRGRTHIEERWRYKAHIAQCSFHILQTLPAAINPRASLLKNRFLRVYRGTTT